MCEHNTTIVKYDQGNVQVEVCTWGCGQTLIAVKDATGLTHTLTAAEISALRERVEALEHLEAVAQDVNEWLKTSVGLKGSAHQRELEAALQAP